MSMEPREPPPSPCIQVCELDADGICRGCLRSRDEITLWTRLSPAQQWAVVDRCMQRLERVNTAE